MQLCTYYCYFIFSPLPLIIIPAFTGMECILGSILLFGVLSFSFSRYCGVFPFKSVNLKKDKVFFPEAVAWGMLRLFCFVKYSAVL